MHAKKPSTIFFDLGNVLIFFSREKMLNQLSQLAQVPFEQMDACIREKLPLLESGKITNLEFYSYLQEISSTSFEHEQMAEAFSDIFIPNLEVWPIVEELKAKNHRLVLLQGLLMKKI